MPDNLSENDKVELERRRLIENVTESIESTLRKRYTWLAIIVSFLIGSGVTATVISLTSGAQKKLIETEIMLTKAKSSLEEVDNLSSGVQEKYKNIDRDLSGLFEGKNIFIDRLTETNARLDSNNKKLEELAKVVNTLIDKNIKTKDIGKIALTHDDSKLSAQQKLELSRYTVYLHYSNTDDKLMIEDLEKYLKNLGYVIPRIQKVTDKARDIRYFHNEDEDAANKLKEHVIEYLSSKKIARDITLPSKNLKTSFPDVRAGLIEVWLYL